MKCLRCGLDNVDGATFCGNCGNIIAPSTNKIQTNASSLLDNNIENITKQNITTISSGKNIVKIIVTIIITLAIIVGGVIGANYVFKDKEDNQITTNNNESSNLKEPVPNEVDNNGKYDDFSMVIDGNEIKLPMKFSDFEAMGFYEMGNYDISVLDEMCNPNSSCGNTYNSNMGNVYGLFTNGTTSHIDLVFYNDSSEQKPLKDCYITKVGFEINRRNNNDFIQLKVGEVKIVNKTRKIEAIVGKTLYEDIESGFGSHYQYDYTNTLTYYPDLKSDGVIGMDDLSFYKTLHMFFDNDTRVLDIYDLYLYDTGNLEK